LSRIKISAKAILYLISRLYKKFNIPQAGDVLVGR
jgi:hypothetical protein